MKQEFFFGSADNKHILHAVKWLPEVEPKMIVQIIHGMNEYILRYDDFATFLCEHGIAVYGHDQLGHGQSVFSNEELGYFCKDHPMHTLIKDIHMLRALAQEDYPNVPFVMLGHSMGSYLLRCYITKYAKGLSGALLLGTGFTKPVASDFGLALTKILGMIYSDKHRSKLIQKIIWNSDYKDFDTTRNTIELNWLSHDYEAVKAFYANPMCRFLFTVNGFQGLFEAVNYSCRPAKAKKIPKDLPICLLSGRYDPVGSLGQGVVDTFLMYKNAGLSHVSMHLYPHARHEILNEINKYEIYEDIVKYLRSITK